MDWAHVVLLLAGVTLAGWNSWQHLGRTSAARAWAHGNQPRFKTRSVLILRPLIAAVLILGAATGPAAASDAATVTVGLLVLVCLLLLLGYLALPLPIPAWTQPRWYRRSHARHD
jgi:antibiotic biosynthesis monooxygenase (ABM) superfamily enzyme